MTEIGVLEAEGRLSELISRAERGEETVITRAGKPIAKIVPMRVDPPFDHERAKQSVERIRQRAKEMNLGPFDWQEWKRYRDEGKE